jgi:hypothetical protein
MNKILILILILIILYKYNNCMNIEGLESPVSIYNENTPRWMRLIDQNSGSNKLKPDNGHTGIDFTQYMIDGLGIPRQCPGTPPQGCPRLYEPHLGSIPRGYPDMFADIRDSGSINGDIIRSALDPENLLTDGVNPFSERELENLLNHFERQKRVPLCGSYNDQEDYDEYDEYKCDYNEDGELTYIKVN